MRSIQVSGRATRQNEFSHENNLQKSLTDTNIVPQIAEKYNLLFQDLSLLFWFAILL
jgi:hypothetical protein